MRQPSASTVRRPRDGQRGQSLAMVGFALTGVLALLALVIDLGAVYYCYQELVQVTNSAALAGGEGLPLGTAQSSAYAYSGDPNSPANATYNIHGNLDITNVTVSLACISTTTYPNVGLPPCIAYGTQAAANAIQVTETAQVPLYFARLFGVNSITVQATSSASAKGGGAGPYNIVMVLDTTNSMATSIDTACSVPGLGSSPSAEECAQYGIQQLISQLDPCSLTLTNCGTDTNGNYKNPVDQVALMVFPGLCSDTASKVTTSNCPSASTLTTPPAANSTYASNDYSCPPSNPPITPYNNNAAYLVLPLQSDYRVSDTAASLNAGTNLVDSVGAGVGYSGYSSCTGVQAPGGEGTFYAGAIDAAQTYLTANARTDVQNVIILLSDGDANATCTATATNKTGTSCTSGDMAGTVSCFSIATVCTESESGTMVYPWTNECKNAVTEAQNAIKAGTLIYSVSYGSENSGCTTDSNYSPCQTMASIASSPSTQYFFSVPQTVNGKQSTVCTATNDGGLTPRSDTSLDQVFMDIADDLTTSRLISNSIF